MYVVLCAMYVDLLVKMAINVCKCSEIRHVSGEIRHVSGCEVSEMSTFCASFRKFLIFFPLQYTAQKRDRFLKFYFHLETSH